MNTRSRLTAAFLFSAAGTLLTGCQDGQMSWNPADWFHRDTTTTRTTTATMNDEYSPTPSDAMYIPQPSSHVQATPSGTDRFATPDYSSARNTTTPSSSAGWHGHDTTAATDTDHPYATTANAGRTDATPQSTDNMSTDRTDKRTTTGTWRNDTSATRTDTSRTGAARTDSGRYAMHQDRAATRTETTATQPRSDTAWRSDRVPVNGDEKTPRPTEAMAMPDKDSGPHTDSGPRMNRGIQPTEAMAIPHRDQGMDTVTTTEDARPARAADARADRGDRARSGDRAGMVSTVASFPTGDPSTSVLSVERVYPAEVNAGQSFDYTLRVKNLTNQRLSQVSVSEEMGNTFKLASADPQASSTDNGTMTWALGDLGPRETKVIHVSGSPANDSGMITACSNAKWESAMCSTINVVQPQIAVTLTAPREALACEDIPLRLVVTNNGTGTARNVRINAPLPQNVTLAEGGNSLALDAGNIPAGRSKEFTVRARPAGPGELAFNVTAAGEGNLTSQPATATTVVRQPVLSVRQGGSEKQYTGNNFTQEIVVTNTSDTPARNAVIEQSVTRGARIVSAGNEGRVGNGRVTWNLGSLDPNQSRTVTITMNAPTDGTFTTTTTARADCAQPVTASRDITVTGIPGLLLQCVDQQDPVEVGREVTYVITVTNQGTADATNVRVRAVLPENEEFVSATGQTTATADGKTITFAPVANLGGKKEATWNVTVRATAPGDTLFKTFVAADQLTQEASKAESTTLYK